MTPFPIKNFLAACFGIVLLAGFATVNAQPRGGSAAAGGGYAKVYEAAGRSAAARGVQQTMNTTLLKAVAKSRVVKSAAVAGGRRQAPKKAAPTAAPLPAPANNYAFFKPDPNTDNFGSLADSLGKNEQEKDVLRQLFAATKTAFEKEVAAKGRRNNLAAAFTLFTASAVTVYHDDPEPSDEAVDKLWDGLNSVFDESPEMAKLTDAEKQQLYDTLIALSGLVLAGYMEGKNSGDTETQTLFKTLAGAMIEQVLKTDPEKARFGKGGLDVKG